MLFNKGSPLDRKSGNVQVLLVCTKTCVGLHMVIFPFLSETLICQWWSPEMHYCEYISRQLQHSAYRNKAFAKRRGWRWGLVRVYYYCWLQWWQCWLQKTTCLEPKKVRRLWSCSVNFDCIKFKQNFFKYSDTLVCSCSQYFNISILLSDTCILHVAY